jgi:hypothetical protein
MFNQHTRDAVSVVNRHDMCRADGVSERLRRRNVQLVHGLDGTTGRGPATGRHSAAGCAAADCGTCGLYCLNLRSGGDDHHGRGRRFSGL